MNSILFLYVFVMMKKRSIFLLAPVAWNKVDNLIQREDVNFVRFDQEERIRTDIARS